MVKQEEIMQLLEHLLKMDDVLACMLAKKGLEGIIPTTMKIKDLDFWVMLKGATDQLFDLINKFFDYGNTRASFEIGKYNVIVQSISRDYSLIVVLPELANTGVIEIAIENTAHKIKQIVGA